MRQLRDILPVLSTGVVFVVLFVAAGLSYEGFFSVGVFLDLLADNAFLGIVAIGMTFVILSGGIDLSVGSIVAFASILSAVLISSCQLHPLLAFFLVLLAGAAIGAVHGALIAGFEMPPFLVTLAGMFLVRGLGNVISLERVSVNHPVFDWFMDTGIPLGENFLPMTSLSLVVVFLAGTFVARRTGFGRNVYALGGNEQSAMLMGIPTGRTKFQVYLLSGVLAAFGGIIFTLYTGAGNSSAVIGLELDAIAAVVIGGTLLTGGLGWVTGSLFGVLIIGVIQTILVFDGRLSSWWTRIVIGALLLAFVLLQRAFSSVSEKEIPE